MTMMALLTCALFFAVAAAKVGDQPSFLFILGDDIGWADFSYNNGTGLSPFLFSASLFFRRVCACVHVFKCVNVCVCASSHVLGTAASPRIKEWVDTPGTITMQDFHSGESLQYFKAIIIWTSYLLYI